MTTPNYPPPMTQWYQGPYTPARPSSGGFPVWAIAGLAAVALGAWAYYAFGPDARRYLKIRSM